ncbi:Putative bifunctional cbb3-type cytochrome c oxidase subunit II/cytochrome c [Candidatus Ornithobacterium hominis]|uniref:c-type cytochrome n=1 Tax=Candidatus Ornithobacterium hominis TaxID=2497989 RepID=UPI0024BCFE2C|nr:cytochrome c [Candidatus Ornithobacterium hominis]CAI9430184.1 Putative bifunctional cbb3-type cytochrome c oxidase subunit II/cytochrome c [Candidatus Ornithobacterium hominis]
MKNLSIIFIFTSFLASCSGPERSPSPVFMPDMYYSDAYEPYAKSTAGYPNDKKESEVYALNNHGMSSLIPVEGTVPKNEIETLPYELPNSNEGYLASMNLESPLNPSNAKSNIARGEKLYNQACAACHGVVGDGQGPIVQSGAYLGVPNYKDRQITVGSVYHVIMHGRNAMGSYASHFTDGDRWRVAEYVMELKNK